MGRIINQPKLDMTNALIKAQEVRVVRKQYEDAETKEDRIKFARLLEQLDKKSSQPIK